MEPIICSECQLLHDECCYGDPRWCALDKARRVKAAMAEALRTGETEEAVVARWDEAEEAAIVEQMGDMAAYMKEVG